MADVKKTDAKKSESIIPPFSFNTRMQCQGAFAFPVMVFCAVCLYARVVSAEDFSGVLRSPIALILILLVDFVWPNAMFSYFTKKIRQYDGSDASARVTNKYVNMFQKVAIGTAVLNAPLMVAAPAVIAASSGMKLENTAVVCAAFGSVLTMGLFPYILFTQQVEHNLSAVPFKREEIPMSFVVRNITVIILSALGLMFFTVTPIFSSANAYLTAYQLFYEKILPCSAVALICMIADNVVLQLGTRKKIEPITKFAFNLSNRDYSQENLKIMSRDEIGYLQQSVNSFYNVTRTLLGAMTFSINNTNNNAHTLATNMTETSSAITEITANIESVKTRIINQAAGVEQAEATINSMVNQLETLAQSVERQSIDIANSSSAVEEMVANVRSVTDILLKNTEAVNQLTVASDNGRIKVEDAVDRTRQVLEESAGLMEASEIIQNIAEQTNLLAMNAAIEAAHAGEAGKGFAVVSDEIRKLAEQSNSQGRTITAQLEKLQESITDITNATKEVQNQFQIIENLADTVKNQGDVVGHAMQEQSSGNAQVLDSIKSMKDSTMTLQNGSREIHTGSREISAQMSSLSQVTEEINGAMTEIVGGVEAIASSVVEVNNATSSTRDNLNMLASEIVKFKIKK